MRRLIAALFLAGTVSGGAASFDIWPMPPKAPGVSDAEYAAPQEYSYFRYFQDQIDKARSAPVDLIFDGDSLTNYWPGIDAEGWKQHYGALNVIDFGSEGHDRVENLTWRLEHGELDGIAPKLIVLEIGQGNIGANSPEETAAGIKLAVDACRQRSPDSHILLMGVFPRGASSSDPLRAIARQINAIIAKLDDGQHVTYLDIGGKFLQPDGTLAPDLAPDPGFEHMAPKGYQAWADAIQPIVDRYCAKSVPAPPVTSASSGEPKLSWPCPMSPPSGVSSASYPTPPIYWILRFVHNLDQLKPGPCDLLFDGDSITDNWQGRGADVWKERYGSRKAVDMGIGGDEVQNVLWRVRHGELEGQDPKLIVLLIGINNHGQDPKAVAAGIKLILDEYKTRCPHAHILLQGIFPQGAAAGTPARDWISQVNGILATYDDGNRVSYLDFGGKFLAPDGTMLPDVMGGDFLHPVAKGYTIWADSIQPFIEKYLPKNQ
jgi:lysophospholipase L1-like esterase